MALTINVTSTLANPAPFPGIWETQEIGYVSTDSALTGSMGILSTNVIFGNIIEAVGECSPGGTYTSGFFLLLMAAGASPNLFSQVTANRGGVLTTFTALDATLYPTGSQPVIGTVAPTPSPIDGPMWIWAAPASPLFAAGLITTLTFLAPLSTPSAPSGNGDITDPEAWQDFNGNIPPVQFSNVPLNVNYPLNG